MDFSFWYKYTLSSDILVNVKKLASFSMFESILLVLFIILLSVLVLFILPRFYIIKVNIQKLREKRKRKNLIKQIAMQKDIEDEIEREIEEEDAKTLELLKNA